MQCRCTCVYKHVHIYIDVPAPPACPPSRLPARLPTHVLVRSCTCSARGMRSCARMHFFRITYAPLKRMHRLWNEIIPFKLKGSSPNSARAFLGFRGSRKRPPYLSKEMAAWLLRHPQNLSFSKTTNEPTSPPMNLSKTISFSEFKEVWVMAFVHHLTYTRSPLQDSHLFGPSPWKVLALIL